jgi:peptidoglycan/LPS O-acetylase OafA/YrhL
MNKNGSHIKLEVLPKTTFSLVIQLVGSLGVTFVFSYISYHYIERPFLRLKNRMY